VDATNFTGSGSLDPPAVVGPLTNVPLPIVPTVKITSIDGTPVPARPAAEYTIPDVSMNKATPVVLNLAAQDVPLGTQLTLEITAEGTDLDQVVTSTALIGTLANSTATANVTFPMGVTRFFARAVW
jgi:hypothetical protein